MSYLCAQALLTEGTGAKESAPTSIHMQHPAPSRCKDTSAVLDFQSKDRSSARSSINTPGCSGLKPPCPGYRH